MREITFSVYFRKHSLALFVILKNVNSLILKIIVLVWTGKNYTYLVLQHIKKCYTKISSVFLIIQKTVKMRVFLGGRNGMKQMYELKKLVTISELWISNFFSKSNFVSTISKSAVTKKNVKVVPKKNLETPLCRPLLDPPDFRKTYFM